MRFLAPLFALPLFLSITTTSGGTVQERADSSYVGGYAEVCKKISQSISSASAVYYPGKHRFAISCLTFLHELREYPVCPRYHRLVAHQPN